LLCLGYNLQIPQRRKQAEQKLKNPMVLLFWSGHGLWADTDSAPELDKLRHWPKSLKHDVKYLLYGWA